MRYLSAFVLSTLIASNANAAIVSKDVEYSDATKTKLKGTLVYDDAITSAKPGVLLIPEWWGDNAYIKTRAHQMAEKGYTAFVADMYGDGKSTENAKQATEWSKPFYADRAFMRSRAGAALDVLRGTPHVDKENILIEGFCMGGTIALELARAGENVKGVATFHAGLQFTDSVKPGAVKAKLLVNNGALDPMVPMADRSKFIEEMNTAKADFRFIEYSGAIHAYTNPDADRLAKANNLTSAVGYNKQAEQDSFKALDGFTEELFPAK